MASTTLKCIICPKNPTFSDVSHLLTHVSSKGHLSHQFKLKVRSQQEPEINGLLADYDRWYNEHDLGRLLSDRMFLKDSKKTGTRNRTRKSDAPQVGESKVTKRSPSNQSQFQREHEYVLDPRLSQGRFDEQRISTQIPSLPWPPAAIRNNESSRRGLHSVYPGADETESDTESLQAQHTRSTYPNPLTIAPTLQPARGQVREHYPDPTPDLRSPSHASHGRENMEDVDAEDAANLKGVMWPGMGLFDSASEEMKRKRNQRKDGSILEQMELTSTTVQPTEVIFSPSGEFKKQRYISGMVEISSPLKGETPLVKKRAARTKQIHNVLTESSANIAIGAKRRSRKANAATDNDDNLRDLSRRTLPLLDSSPPARKSRRFNGMKPKNEEDIEFRLTTGEFNDKKSRGMKIFEDSSARIWGVDNKDSASRTGPMMPQMSSSGRVASTQTQGRSSLVYSHLQSVQHPHGRSMADPRSMQRKPGDQSANMSGVGEGKENIEQLTNHQIRLEPTTSSGEQMRQRYFAIEDGHQPNFSSRLNPQMDFGVYGGSSWFTFPASNPLALTSPSSSSFTQHVNDSHLPHPFQRGGGVHTTSPENKGWRSRVSNTATTSPSHGRDFPKSEYDLLYHGGHED